MTRYFLFLLLTGVSIFNASFAQNLMGNSWITGAARAVEVQFTDTSKPSIKIRYSNANTGYPYLYAGGASNICDSATGNLLFSCTGMLLHDSTGAIMDNGDHLVENSYYYYTGDPSSFATQASIILPKGSAGQYYVFINTISDSAWDFYVTNQGGANGAVPCDRLQVNIVDMNLNGGLGSVIVKNKPLLQGAVLQKVMMQACRHSNGVDWWLLKQGEYDTNRIYRFLVKADTILGPYIQSFPEPKYSTSDLYGQYAFSKDGNKFASVQVRSSKVFVADFDRCTGELLNPKTFNIPFDSTTIPNAAPWMIIDSVAMGVSFSPNGKFIYLTRRYNIYQLEPDEPDSNLAWVNIKHGPDTSYAQFQYYNQLYRGPDGRIYIGYFGGQAMNSSVIDKPDIKGLGCEFCRKCLRLDTNLIFGLSSPPNMPDYTLGAAPGPCWPVGNQSESAAADKLEVYPNPVNSILYIKNAKGKKKELFSFTGQLLLSTNKDEIEVGKFSKGIYYLRCEGQRVKVVVE